MRKLALLMMSAVIGVLLVSYVVYAYVQDIDRFTVTATPDQLWPPSHKMVAIRLDGFCNWQSNGSSCTKENPCQCCKNFHIESVTSHEPISSDDYFIDNSTRPPGLFLKAERLGNGDGRAYIITVTEDQRICCTIITDTTTVTVPHNK